MLVKENLSKMMITRYIATCGYVSYRNVKHKNIDFDPYFLLFIYYTGLYITLYPKSFDLFCRNFSFIESYCFKMH